MENKKHKLNIELLKSDIQDHSSIRAVAMALNINRNGLSLNLNGNVDIGMSKYLLVCDFIEQDPKKYIAKND